MDLNQWMNLDGSYIGTSNDTAKTMKPGIYDMTIFNQQLIFIPVEMRSDELLRFPDTATDKIVAEIQKFWEREDKFRKHELPFKRGVLMYGPPGSGKSCTMRLVADDVVTRGGVVFLYNNPDVFTAGYRIFRTIQPETPLVVMMEDLDAILDRYNETRILNLLDGIEEVDKVVFLASTNYPEKLGPRITNRPSRFDRKFKIAHPSDPARRMYLSSLSKGDDQVNLEKWSHDTQGMSLAHLKELFIAVVILGNDYMASLTILKGMKEHTTSVGDDEEFDSPHTGQYA